MYIGLHIGYRDDAGIFARMEQSIYHMPLSGRVWVPATTSTVRASIASLQ